MPRWGSSGRTLFPETACIPWLPQPIAALLIDEGQRPLAIEGLRDHIQSFMRGLRHTVFTTVRNESAGRADNRIRGDGVCVAVVGQDGTDHARRVRSEGRPG